MPVCAREAASRTKILCCWKSWLRELSLCTELDSSDGGRADPVPTVVYLAQTWSPTVHHQNRGHCSEVGCCYRGAQQTDLRDHLSPKPLRVSAPPSRGGVVEFLAWCSAFCFGFALLHWLYQPCSLSHTIYGYCPFFCTVKLFIVIAHHFLFTCMGKLSTASIFSIRSSLLLHTFVWSLT